MAEHEGGAVLQYKISFAPDHYYVSPMQAGTSLPYWAVVSTATRTPIAFAFDENMAKTLCLSLELVRAQVYGDTKRATALLKLIDKFNDMPSDFFKDA